jgi:hypothetical protein
MLHPQPRRDWVSTIGGVGAAIILSAGLAFAFAGPAGKIAVPLQEVWVSIVRPTPVQAKPRPGTPVPPAEPAKPTP